ncbi:hypothetical protein INR49_015729, partial [Caranx melampygus]
MRPVDVAGIQGLRPSRGLSFLVKPIVKLQHPVHPSPPGWVLRHPNRTVHLSVHTDLRFCSSPACRLDFPLRVERNPPLPMATFLSVVLWRTQPEGKSILHRLRNIESLTDTAAQLLHSDTAEPFYSQVDCTVTKQ